MTIDFKPRRFLLLLRKFIRENKKAYTLYLAGAIGILFLIYGLAVFTSIHNIFPKDLQQIFFAIGLLFGGSYFSATFYSFFSSTAKGIQFLQLPVSNGEKLLLSYLFTQVVFFISYMLIFLGIDWMLCSFYNHFVAIPTWANPLQLHLFKAYQIDLTDERNELAILGFFLLSSIAHFGSLAFNKQAFVKTAIVLIICFAAISFYNQYSMLALVPSVEIMPHGMFFTDAFRIDSPINKGNLVVLPRNWMVPMYCIMPVIIYISFWTGSYFKLKEKQV